MITGLYINDYQTSHKKYNRNSFDYLLITQASGSQNLEVGEA